MTILTIRMGTVQDTSVLLASNIFNELRYYSHQDTVMNWISGTVNGTGNQTDVEDIIFVDRSPWV